ncbi:MAG: hypothetical protein AAF192_03985, partial [Pseudomonadota bacterium]
MSGAAAAGLTVAIEVSPGELIDKITILEIKCERIADAGKRASAAQELAVLAGARDAAVPAEPWLDDLSAALREVNEDLWAVEDDLRACEARGDCASGFGARARSVYRLTDRRAALTREINDRLGAGLR